MSGASGMKFVANGGSGAVGRADDPEGPHPVDRHVGLRIRMRRKELGISQEKLAEALGLTFQQVQKYERAANRISASRLYRMGMTLGVDAPYFYEGYRDDGSSGFAEPTDAAFASDQWRGAKPTSF